MYDAHKGIVSALLHEAMHDLHDLHNVFAFLASVCYTKQHCQSGKRHEKSRKAANYHTGKND
jgi:hypothetical protein